MASGIDCNREVPKTQEKDTRSNHLVLVMLTFYDSDLKTVKGRSRSKFRGWGRWVISANFQSESIRSLVVLAKV